MTPKEQERYQKALEYAALKHKGQYRKEGQEYITHPIATAQTVMEKGGDIDSVITALFHDLLEDTDATPAEIEKIGGKKVLEAVILLTKEPGYIMEEYISRIRANRIAFLVKGADRLHNLRSALHTGEAFRRKYIAETRLYYMDFLPEIPEAVEALERSLEN